MDSNEREQQDARHKEEMQRHLQSAALRSQYKEAATKGQSFKVSCTQNDMAPLLQKGDVRPWGWGGTVGRRRGRMG